ncbi:MAG: heme-binding protein [Steroidobacteraceae bacterium]
MKQVTSLIVISAMGLSLGAGLTHAQNTAPPAAAAAATDATRLPGDNSPGGMGAGGPPPGAAPGGASVAGAAAKPPQEPGTDAPGPSLALAIEAAQAAIAACLADGYKVGATVIDSSGQPRAALTADGATGGHAYTAVRKGLAALAFNLPTSQVAAKITADKEAAVKVTPNMMTWAGAVPLSVQGKAIGAIGVSGASSAQDEKCAVAGAAKIQSRLK